MSDTALRYLHATATQGSMRAAGEMLNVAVSSISRQIAQLEASLGMRLLESGRRSIKLTAAGRMAVDFYRTQIAQREAFAARLEGLRHVNAGTVTLALGDGAPTRCICRALDRFQAEHPGVRLAVVATTLDGVARMILDDEADIALSLAGPADPKLRVRSASRQPLTVVVHPGHPLARSAGVTLAELASHDLCLPPAGSRLRQLLAPAELRQQTWLRAAVTASSVQTLRELALAGHTATVVPRIAAQAELEDGALIGLPLLGVEIEAPRLELVFRLGRQLPPAAMLVMAAIERLMTGWAEPVRAEA